MCRGRFFLVPLLAIGTVAGFASGFASLHHHHCCWGAHDWQQPAAQVQAPATPAPVIVQQPAAAPQPAQTLVIPIIVGAPASTNPAQPTTVVVPAPAQPAAPAAPAPAPASGK